MYFLKIEVTVARYATDVITNYQQVMTAVLS